MTPAEARAKARRAGAALADLARAVTPPERDADDGRPAPEDRCIYCDGWGCFPDVDAYELDGDVPCGHCSETGIEP